MNNTERRVEKTQYNYWFLLLLAAVCFLATLGVGLLSGVLTAWPPPVGRALTLRTLQPLHTTLALCWLFSGCAALVGLYGADGRLRTLQVSRAQLAATLLFLGGALTALAQNRFSGREYLTWPVSVSVPLLGSFLLNLLAVVFAWRRLCAHSGEAAWLVLLGAILLPAGLVESHLYLLDAVGANPGRDLAIQWHALDTIIAGWIVILYGIGMLLLPAGAKPMRGGWLFALAVIGILLDFGHHNYPSPQPHLIKLVSFTATMLGTFSFLRHLRSVRRASPAGDPVARCLRHVEGWTLFAVGTGILLAIPQINLYAHGTYVIVAHTMGSIIGVNSMLILIAGLVWAGETGRLRPALLRWNGISLAVFCAALSGLGLAKGIVRIDQDFLAWNAALRPFYLLIPLAALPLCATLGWLGLGLVRSILARLRFLTADDLASAIPDLRKPAAVPAEERESSDG